MFKLLGISNIFKLVKKGVQMAILLSLIADTLKYFHDEGLKRGLFVDEKKANENE